MMEQKIYTSLLVVISVACCAGEHFDTQQDMTKSNEQLKEITQKVNKMSKSVAQIEDIIAKIKAKQDSDPVIEYVQNGYCIIERRNGRIVSMHKIVSSSRL